MDSYAGNAVLLLKVFTLSSQSRQHIFTKTRNLCSLPTPDTAYVVRSLIAIFTKQPSASNDPELQHLAPSLSTKIVESVLNELKSWKIAFNFFSWASGQSGYAHNCYTYNAMASILSRARRNAQLRELAIKLVDSRCDMTPGALGYFIRCLGTVGLVEEANLVFDKVKQMGLCVPNSYSYNCLLEAISRSSEIAVAEMRLKEMTDLGWTLDKYTLTSVLQLYCNSGKFERALSVFNEMHIKGWVDTHVCCILALSFSKWGEVDKAFELIQRMEDLSMRLNEKTFFVLIHGFVQAWRLDRALQLFDKMLKSGFSPDISLYDVLIDGLCKNKDFEKAFLLYLQMKEYGIKADIGLLKKLTSYFSEKELFQLLKEMPEDVDSVTKTLLFNSVLSFYVNSDSADKAYLLLHAMIGHGSFDDLELNWLLRNSEKVVDTTSFTLVINGLLKDGKLDLSLTLFREMDQVGCKRTVLLYNNLISGLCHSNRLDEGNKLLQEMKNLGIGPTQFTYNCIYGCLCTREDIFGALNCVKEMHQHGYEPWIKHSTSLIKQLCEKGRVLEACKFLNDLVIEGFLPDIVAYSAALSGLVKIHEVDQAVELFRGLCARGSQPDVVAYNILINGLCKAKRVSEAQEILDEMVINGLVPSVVTYNSLIDGWCKNGDIDQARLALSRIYEAEMKPNVISYTSLIDGLCNVGRPNDALMLWKDMLEKGCEPNRIAFMAMVCGLCKCDRPDEALEYLHQMQEKEMKPDTFVYVTLLGALASDQNLSAALEILKELVKVGTIPGSADKNYPTFKDVIIQLLKNTATSTSLRKLIEEGSIPEGFLSDGEIESELNPKSS